MPRYAKPTDLGAKAVIEKAAAYFGPGGLGLDIVEQGECCLRFQGGGGHVFVEIEEKGNGSEVDIETREWDYHVKEFLKKI
jgi:hypothetical protein